MCTGENTLVKKEKSSFGYKSLRWEIKGTGLLPSRICVIYLSDVLSKYTVSTYFKGRKTKNKTDRFRGSYYPRCISILSRRVTMKNNGRKSRIHYPYVSFMKYLCGCWVRLYTVSLNVFSLSTCLLDENLCLLPKVKTCQSHP